MLKLSHSVFVFVTVWLSLSKALTASPEVTPACREILQVLNDFKPIRELLLSRVDPEAYEKRLSDVRYRIQVDPRLRAQESVEASQRLYRGESFGYKFANFMKSLRRKLHEEKLGRGDKAGSQEEIKPTPVFEDVVIREEIDEFNLSLTNSINVALQNKYSLFKLLLAKITELSDEIRTNNRSIETKEVFLETVDILKRVFIQRELPEYFYEQGLGDPEIIEVVNVIIAFGELSKESDLMKLVRHKTKYDFAKYFAKLNSYLGLAGPQGSTSWDYKFISDLYRLLLEGLEKDPLK